MKAVSNIQRRDYSGINARKADGVKQELTVKKIETDKRWDSHWHDYLEIRLITSGHGKVYINGERHELKRGCMYLTTPANIHMFVPEGKVELYNITIRESFLFDESIVQKLFAINEMFVCLGDGEFERIFHTVELLEYENRLELEYKEQVVKKLLEYLLLFLMRKANLKLDASDTQISSIQIAQSFIKMHFRENITVEMVADTLGYSVGYFSTFFRKVTGITFIQYLSDMRLEYAKKLLAIEKFTVNEICTMSGFGSYSNFLKAFKKKYGILPKEYKKQKNDKSN